MKNKLFAVLFASVLLLAAQGCAHSPVEDRLDKKLAMEPAAPTRAQLSSQASQLIAQDKDLTPEQKASLASLAKESRARTDALREEALKLRMVLVEDLISADYASGEVDLIKRRIRDLEQAKLAEYFRAIREANVILGRWASRNQRTWSEYDTDFYNQVMMQRY